MLNKFYSICLFHPLYLTLSILVKSYAKVFMMFFGADKKVLNS